MAGRPGRSAGSQHDAGRAGKPPPPAPRHTKVPATTAPGGATKFSPQRGTDPVPAFAQSTSLARLHTTAAHLGITVRDAADDDGPWLSDDSAAIVVSGDLIAINPGLDDDGLRADVLAMALAVTWFTSPRGSGHTRDITAASGFILISRTRVAGPLHGPGKLAAVIASQHGRVTASAAFEYTVPVFG